MKRITYAGVSLVTGDSVTTALQEYCVLLDAGAGSVTVEIPVLEANGEISTHTLLIGPGFELDATDGRGRADPEESALEEAERFRPPVLPQVVQVAMDVPSAEAEECAETLDRALTDLEASLDEGIE